MKQASPALSSKYLRNIVPDFELWKRFTQTLNLAERNRFSKALLKSEANLRSIFDNMDTSYILLDTGLKVVSFNQSAYERILREKGMKLTLGREIIDYTTGERRDNLKKSYDAVLNGQKRGYEVSFLQKDGTLSWYNVKLFPVYIKREITGMIIGIDDITGRKISEEKIAQSDLRFRALVENSHDAITLVDKNLITHYRSSSLRRMLGWNDDEKLHRHLRETVHPEDMKNIVFPLMNELLKYPGRSFPITFRGKHISGNYIWMEGVATNMVNNKNVNAIVVNLRDITERKNDEELIRRSEEQYRQIVETAEEGIWMIDKNNRTNFVNNKMCEILGYVQEEMIGKEIYYFMDDEGKQLASALMEKKKEGHSDQRHFKYISKAGKEVWTNISANPLFNEDGTYKGALAMITDITEKVKLQQQLVDEQVNKQKEITKAAVNAQEKERREIGEELHDNVNQLLAACGLFLSHSLKCTDYKPFVIKSQEYISSAIEEIRKLTKALIGPAKEEAVGLIASVIELIKDISLVKDIKIDFTYPSYKEQCDTGLKIVIYRIIQEQLTNILKHAEASWVEINLKEENGYIELLIKDDGKGFDTDTKKTGIGLKNIQNRSMIYDGNVEITSSPGNGCIVKVIFKNHIK